MNNIIEVKQVNKTFGDNKALKDINLTITNPNMTALLGPSGSGKSTLLRHLSGLIIGDNNAQSKIQVQGRTVQSQGKADKSVRACRAKAGYIFQQFNLVNRLSVMTNVLIGAMSATPKWRTLTGMFTQEQKQQALDALDRVGMASFASQRVSHLSGGQQQRVAIARALMQRAEIIFADEPIASLDPESSRIVMELLQDINQKEGIPIIVTLHQVDHALKYCSEIVALKDGEVFYQGASSSLSSSQIEGLYRARSTTEEPSPCPSSLLAPSF
ncbi:phosphonate ABC transporter ATP-binding protein [Vibrio sp. 10N.286.49.C2]|uniref:phosphonate ABC transporter ATP-binding protein n=1 Tax=unclassified Vibrio TaxID=2614977 RepID=UPI000C831B53|nr:MULTISPECIES: phosphonate ABC transporter ATP-binding protein [unclassified Vibrio]PMH36706.1 phosphonate ABC transporter ATP-binding protein [Vibrio sp. 10N.286.49.C2]PMH54694.1 phosphonate ABC transporter ATP-binding protein [Vibrio sp. 10N.286.49.B1]PMH78311.1 phosphonate ABC transporter ATP-binding protein [Vibrio sp. 10N.286.48.B7]